MNLDRAVTHLQEAIRIKTISTKTDEEMDHKVYESFLGFLEESFPLVHEKLERTLVNHYAPLYYWKGKRSNGRVLFLCHYDVVPAEEESWEEGPFSGAIIDGKIYGRGTSDDKNSVIGLLETFENLLEKDFVPEVDLYLAMGFDEENHGLRGAAKLAEHLEKEGLTFDLILDEGGIVTEGSMMGIDQKIAVIGVAEKGNTVMEFTFTGDEGHSSAPPKSTSIGKMAAFIKDVEDHPFKARLVEPVKSMLETIAPYKSGVEKIALSKPKAFFPIIKGVLEKNKETAAMLRSTISFTMATSGTAPNVLPKKASVTANIRVLPGDSIQDIKRYFKSFGHEMEINYHSLNEAIRVSNRNTEAYQYLEKSIKSVFGDVVTTPYLMIGGTDARHYDRLSENIYRFMPCVLTQQELGLMHAAGEYLSIENLERMLVFYDGFIRNLEELYGI